MIQNRQVTLVNVIANTNNLLINLLINEIESKISQGHKVALIIDNIQLNSAEALLRICEQSGTGLNVILSNEDAYASYGGDDNRFFSFTGKSSKLVIARHSSAVSCQKGLDVIGSYDKQEISNSYSQGASYGKYGNRNTNQSLNVNAKRENIVKQEDIARMQQNEVFTKDLNSNELVNTIVI